MRNLGIYPTIYYIDNRPTTAEPVLFPVADIDDDTLWALMYDWEVRLGDWTFIVPRGRVSNLGTVPWWLRWLMSPTDPVIAIPSIAHDYLVNEWDVTISNVNDDTTHYVDNSGLTWRDGAELFRLWNQDSPSRYRRVKAQIVFYCVVAYGYLLNRKLGQPK